MRLIPYSANNPPAIAAAALIVLLFGLLAMSRLPMQLLPDTRQPTLWVQVEWREAAPNEVEEALVEPIENVMRGMPGLLRMRSESRQGGGGVGLEFEIGTDMTPVLLDVIGRLNQLPPLPPDAEEPRVFAGDNFQGNNAASMLVRPLPGNPERDLAARYQTLMEDVVEPRLAQVPGVSRVNLEGGRPREVQVRFDPYRLAAHGLQPQQIASTVIAARDASAGFADVGRKQVTVRFTGREPVSELGELIVAWSGDRPLYLRDVADIDIGLMPSPSFSYRNGVPGYYITLQRSGDSNIVELLDGVRSALTELNDGPLAAQGLYADLSWDASVYVRRAIGFVRESLLIGVLLAVCGLWYFLRGPRALVVLAATIPLSLAFSVIVLELLGRSLNVISLAGLAFSTGIVIDAALIVQGNVLRYVQAGRSAVQATLEGASEVMPALLASMLTSVAIFLPVLFMEGLEGQLFKDLAITMSVSHAASLLVAMTVIPAANRWALVERIPDDAHAHWWRAMASLAVRWTARPLTRAAWIVTLVGGSLVFIVAMVPKPDYLPVAPSDLIWCPFTLPPGGNIETFEAEVAPTVVERLRPYYAGEREPAIKYYNFSAWEGGNGMLVVYPQDPRDIPEMIEILRKEVMAGLPDVNAYPRRGSLLSVDGNNSREIAMMFQGNDLDALMQVAEVAQHSVGEAIPESYPQAFPSLELNQPELQLAPDEWRIARAGLDRSTVASALRAFTGGLWAGEYFDGGDRLDIIVKGREWHSPEALAETPLATGQAGVLTVGDLVALRQTVGPSQLVRIDGRRTVAVSFQPPDDMSLDEALDVLRNEVEPGLRAIMPPTVALKYAGSASDLAEALRTMAGNFALALVILFALMAALFRSVRDAALVMAVIPVSIAGGVLALRLVGLFSFQALDLLTMIGFIILLGLVVNAAILLVDRAREAERRGLSRQAAVFEALESRARAIVLSTLTAVLGMAPLILMPGLGAEVYRGLAAVVAGGMLIGTLFTWFLMPTLLRLGEPVADARSAIDPMTSTPPSNA